MATEPKIGTEEGFKRLLKKAIDEGKAFYLCMCPDDCNCHHPWRPNYCGCKAHGGDFSATREP